MSLDDKIGKAGGWNDDDEVIQIHSIKLFIKGFEEYMKEKFKQEKDTHKNHRIQALLLDLRAEFTERAGEKLIDNHSPKGKNNKSSSCNEMLAKDNRVSDLQSTNTDGVKGNTLPAVGEMRGSSPLSADTKKKEIFK